MKGPGEGKSPLVVASCLAMSLGQEGGSGRGRKPAGVVFRRMMNLTRSKPPIGEALGHFSVKRGMWFPCLSPVPSPTSACPFLPPSCLQRESRGWDFQVGETRIFISAKKQCSEYFPFINPLKILEKKKKKLYIQK